ncbi:MAG TPA: glycosyltransferase family 39 protein [bacterium]|nr:glycosyltransferase family 39 protein [bacterium]HRV03666.1 glycosyltransferase family 39 protein [Candidatus Ratteibacteria bacterium]
MEKKKLIILLVGIFFLALILRIGFISTLDNTVDVWGDWWDELGWKLATGQGYWVNNPYFSDGPVYYSWRSPVFPLFLAGVYKLFGHSFLAAKICLAIVSSITCLLLFSLSKCFMSERNSIIVALLYAVYPASIFWTGYLAPETLTVFLLTLGIYFAVISFYKRVIFSVITGVVFGIAVLCRSTIIVLIPLVPIAYCILSGKKALKKCLGFLLGLIVLVPWGIRNWMIHHSFVLVSTEGGVVFYIANNEYSLSQESGFYHAENIGEFRNLSEVETDKKFYRMAFDFIKKHPLTYLKLVWDRFIRLWRFYPHTISGPGKNYNIIHQLISLLSEAPLIIFGFCGMLISLKRWRYFFIFYSIVIVYSGALILIRTTIRYRLPLMPIFLIFFVYFITELSKRKRPQNGH